MCEFVREIVATRIDEAITLTSRPDRDHRDMPAVEELWESAHHQLSVSLAYCRVLGATSTTSLKVAAPNLASPRFKANPFPFFRTLRDDAPICRVTLPNGRPAWLITRYDDVLATLKDLRLAKDKAIAGVQKDLTQVRWVPRIVRTLSRNMLDVDEPDHRRLRMLVQKAFTPRVVEELRSSIEEITTRSLDRLSGRSHVDLIREYALPIPVNVIAELLGIPVADRDRFHHWSSHIVAGDTSNWHMLRAIPSVLRFVTFIRRTIALRRQHPGADLISSLVRVEEAGETLSDDELVAMVFLLLVAGHETTVNLIGNGVLTLLEHPEQQRLLASEPERIGPAIEEILRYSGPLQMATERYAVADTPFGGVVFRRGEPIYAVLASANRDERQFKDPDAFSIERDPNKHLAFGFGIHHCLGAALARLEGQIAISRLLQRYPNLRVARAPAALEWRPGLVLRGLCSLPVEL